MLLTLAEAFVAVDEMESARGLFARITHDLADDRWSSPPSVAHHSDYLRGRAFYGLGKVALDDTDADPDDAHTDAASYFESATNLLIASALPAAAAILTELADTVEQELDDVDGAAQIRQAAATLDRSAPVDTRS